MLSTDDAGSALADLPSDAHCTDTGRLASEWHDDDGPCFVGEGSEEAAVADDAGLEACERRVESDA